MTSRITEKDINDFKQKPLWSKGMPYFKALIIEDKCALRQIMKETRETLQILEQKTAKNGGFKNE